MEDLVEAELGVEDKGDRVCIGMAAFSVICRSSSSKLSRYARSPVVAAPGPRASPVKNRIAKVFAAHVADSNAEVPGC